MDYYFLNDLHGQPRLEKDILSQLTRRRQNVQLDREKLVNLSEIQRQARSERREFLLDVG
jgi:hypothetical protein